MKQQLKYRNYYKCLLQEGVFQGFAMGKDLTLHMDSATGACAYLTRMFDTKDEDMTYHRLTVDCDLSAVKLEVIAAAADSPDQEVEPGVLLEDFLASPKVEATRKEAVLLGLPHVRQVNTCDMLLHELKGRYIWIYLAVYPADLQADCTIRGMRLEFPKYSFTEYLPEIYQGNDFFERYIAVLQSLFLDVEKKVEEVPRLLDYEGTEEQYVQELASWIGIDNRDGLFTSEQLRYMISHIDVYQGSKGTRKALEKIVELTVGQTPHIIEAFQWNQQDMSAVRRKAYQKLYGETSNHFCVMLDMTKKQGKLPIPKEKLEKLIENYAMVGTKPKVVVLDKCSHLDGHCYLDVNSALSTPEIASVNHMTLGSHITVG